jgi:hypothetical protein
VLNAALLAQRRFAAHRRDAAHLLRRSDCDAFRCAVAPLRRCESGVFQLELRNVSAVFRRRIEMYPAHRTLAAIVSDGHFMRHTNELQQKSRRTTSKPSSVTHWTTAQSRACPA